MKKTILYLLLALFISCSPLDKKCGEDLETVVTDLKILVESGEITNEEFRILSDKIFSYEDLSKIAGKKTYREILKKAKLVSMLKDQREERELKEMNEALELSLIKGENKIMYKNHTVIYPINIRNKSNREIRGVSGTVIVTDLVDNELSKFELNYEEKIIESTSKKVYYPHYGGGNREILNKGINKLKVKWIPKKILFSDNNQMSVGNNNDIEIKLKNRYTGGGYYKNDWNFLLEFKNNSNKTITAFKGKMNITDLFGNPIHHFEFVVDNEIKPNSTTEKNFRTSCSDAKGNYRFESKKIENFKLEWNIEKIVFL